MGSPVGNRFAQPVLPAGNLTQVGKWVVLDVQVSLACLYLYVRL